MDVGMVLLPLGVMVALGLSVALWSRIVPWPWALLAAALLGVLFSRLGFGPAELLGRDALLRGLGLFCLCGAGALTFLANRSRRRAELAASAAPQSLDEAAAVVRATGRPLQGIFRGRIASDEAVTSPSGVVCAFFEAELRAPADGGRKGPLLTSDRGFGTTLWLKGERAVAAVAFDPRALEAPEETRRCTLLGQLAVGMKAALADGEAPVEVNAFERVGRLGESCLVVGELRPGPSRGSWEIRGAARGPAPVVVGHDASVLGRRARRLCAVYFGAAVLLCACAAWLLSRAG
jgi:hypothetical protein